MRAEHVSRPRMRLMLNRSRTLLLLPALLMAGAPAVAQETKEFRFNTGQNARLSIHNLRGSVTVRPASGSQVNIKARIESPDKVEVDAQHNGNRVEVRSHMLQAAVGDAGAVHYDVQVPAQATLDIESAAGPVQVESIRGGITIGGEAAEVTIRDIKGGSIRVETVAGPVTLQEVQNSRVQVMSTSGKVELINVTGPEVTVKTASGDIRYQGDFSGGGDYSLFNNSGNIVISMPASASVDLKARSRKGSVNVAGLTFQKNLHPGFPLVEGRDFAGKAQKGDSSVEVNSLTGKIRIEKQ